MLGKGRIPLTIATKRFLLYLRKPAALGFSSEMLGSVSGELR